MSRTTGAYLLLILRGMAMGAVDVVPGMSGGTIALITGIYKELIFSIKSFNPRLVTTLRKEGIAAAWKQINGNFLLAVITGVLISIFSLAKAVSWLLANHPMMVWSFFFGLITGSAIYVVLRMERYNLRGLVFFLLGGFIAYYFTIATPATTPEQLWFIFIAGSIAFCAMILPGLSGAFILIFLGKYEFMLNALVELNLKVIAVFAVGGIAGVVAFSNVIGWLFKKHPNSTLALLAGFMAGSLNKLWPWKKTLETHIDSLGEEIPLLEQSISPGMYAEIYGQDPQVLPVLISGLAGLILILGFTLVSRQHNR
ncbi:MAG: DUF368 domain-containing protein [Bacteroidales bacterium]